MSLESELRGVFAVRVKDERERFDIFDEIVARRKDEITVSRVLNMGRTIEQQWCIWWLIGKSRRAKGREDDPYGAPFQSIELRSLVMDLTCPKCGHKWAGTDRERCQRCGEAAANIEHGAYKPLNYKMAPMPLDAKEHRQRTNQGLATAYIKQAQIDDRGHFHVPPVDAITILRRYGKGVITQEWKLKAGRVSPEHGKPSEPRTWNIGDKAIVVEVAHEAMIQEHTQKLLVEA